MYETEANLKIEQSGQIPAESAAAFCELQGKLLSRTLLPWGEHCTECVWPTCYTSCDLYSPRHDGRCRRFAEGMVRIDIPGSVSGYVIKIRFKQWGKLWAPGNLTLRPMTSAKRSESRDRRIGTLLQHLPLPDGLTRIVVSKRYGFKKRMAVRRPKRHETPTSFVMECFNPTDVLIRLGIIIRPSTKQPGIAYQHVVEVRPGFLRTRIPYEEIAALVDLDSPFGVEILPADSDAAVTLYFGLMDFVKEVASPHKEVPPKCVVWDLDNTLWEGTLVEDRAGDLRLRPGVAAMLDALDRRGILLSIASKNDHDEAMTALRRFGLDHFFLAPQISWSTKSSAIRNVARQLNIGLDSILFVDDSAFELQEVRSACPEVRCIDAVDSGDVLTRVLMELPVTPESGNRRSLYRVEEARKVAETSFSGDYRQFLMDCRICLSVESLNEDNLCRVHELTQRTNQMNFSGTRYNRDVLRDLLTTPHHDTYVLSCQDRFGSYGIVGFAIMDRHEPRLTDLMFSCRVQSKRVEHAFVAYLITRYLGPAQKPFYASYRKTSRNAVSGQVFADLGMRECGTDDGVTLLSFPGGQPAPNEGLITIEQVDSKHSSEVLS